MQRSPGAKEKGALSAVPTKRENLFSVMLGLVPSICNVSIFHGVGRSRHKAEDDGGGWGKLCQQAEGDLRFLSLPASGRFRLMARRGHHGGDDGAEAERADRPAGLVHHMGERLVRGGHGAGGLL